MSGTRTKLLSNPFFFLLSVPPLLQFTHPRVVSILYKFISSVEHKIRYFGKRN